MAKKKKSKKKGKSFLLLLFVIIILVGVVVICYPGYTKAMEASKEIKELTSQFDKLDSVTETDLEFFTPESEFYSFVWDSADENLITKTGICKRPLYADGDKKVIISLSYEVKGLSFIDGYIFELLKITSGKLEKEITIVKMPMDDEDIVDAVYEALSMPVQVYTSIGLPYTNPNYNSVTINWVSSNEEILKSDGTFVGKGKVTLNATISSGTKSKNKEFLITVNDDLSIEEMSYDFADYSDSTYDNDEYKKITLNNAKSDEENVKFEIDSTNASIITSEVLSPLSVSFTYEYYETSKSTTYKNKSYVKLYSSIDKTNYVLIKTEELSDSDSHEFMCNLSEYDFTLDKCFFKIELSSDYAAGSKSIVLDDFKIIRAINDIDIKNDLDTIIPSSISDNVFLPSTTNFGGIITYTSNNPNLSSLGVVTKTEESQTVKLSISVTGFTFVVSYEKEIKISGTKDVVPVEVRFIDVGKYGHNDCGESIYIKYGDKDVLIDAGDDYQDTVKAVKEVIDANSNDKILDYVIATHPDADHIGSMDVVITDYEVLNIITFMGDYTSGVYEKYNEAVTNENCNVCKVVDSYNNVGSCKRVIELGPEVFIEIINTEHYNDKENNARSVVCVLNAYGTRSLFTGDADNGADANLESDYMNSVKDIDLLKAVHHATENGTTSAFLEAVDPEIVIITSGNYFGNKHGHPTYNAIKRMYDYDEDMLVYAVVGGDVDTCELTSSGSYKCEPTDYMKDRNGTITAIIDNNGIHLSSEYFGNDILELKDTDFWAVRSEIN